MLPGIFLIDNEFLAKLIPPIDWYSLQAKKSMVSFMRLR